MSFFNRSKKEVPKDFIPPPLSPPKKCEHKFQDFPWYIEGEESGNDTYGFSPWYHLAIKEPYVCIYCGERHDKVLWEIKRYGSHKEAIQALDEINKEFKDRIKHRAIIEDMINDMKLVDPQYLQYYHMLQGTKDPSTSRQDNFEVKKDFDLKV